MPLAQREEPFLDRQDLRRSVAARVSGAPRASRIAAEAMPQPKQAAIERERLAAEPFRRGRRGQIERTEQVPGDVRPTELALTDDILQIGGQAVAAENAGERRAQDGLQHVGPAGGGNAIDHERAGDEASRASVCRRWSGAPSRRR